MSRNPDITTHPALRYLAMLLMVAVVGYLLSGALVSWTERQHYQTLEREGNQRLELYASTVQSARQRFDYLPYIVSQDPQVSALLSGGSNGTEVSRMLRAWQTESGAAVLYLMNHEGEVVASSNWQEAESFVGNNYHFRPYFQDAISGREGQFFAVGASTGRPGLFLSRPVLREQQIIGVAVIKIDMAQLESDWKKGGEMVLVADNEGVIFLASNPAWKYHSLQPINEATRQRLNQARKYSNRQITPLPISESTNAPEGYRVITLPSSTTSRLNQHYLMHQRPLDDLNWTLYYLSDLQPLTEQKRSAQIIALLLSVLLALLGFILINRSQSRRLLEQRVTQRTRDLNQTNQRLQQEIDNRIETEKQLHQTHEGLVHAEKLAALGQMSAGIVHEISQPLSAMQTFVASTRLLLEREDRKGAEENLDDISSMIRRVNSIVGHLKSFASKSRGQTSSIEVSRVIDNAMLILKNRLHSSQVLLDIQYPEQPVRVIADEIKLEQILINLIRNALDAMQEPAGDSPHRLTIRMYQQGAKTHITIADTGTGINPDDLPKVFDPFFTTKPTGEGLGLGLSVSYGIAKEFGGDLSAMPNEGCGTRFTLSLDSAQQTGTLNEQQSHA